MRGLQALNAGRRLQPLARGLPLSRPANSTGFTLPRAPRPISQSRPFSSSSSSHAQYRRFDYQPPGQGGGRQNVTNYLRRRVGGDRGLVIYGVAITGGVAYYLFHLERVPITGRLRFMDCSPEQEAEIGAATFSETMDQFNGRILSPNHPVSRRVREIAKRIVERNGLGHIKAGHTLSSLEGIVPGWGGGASIDPNTLQLDADLPNANSEWEVYVVDDQKTKNAFVIPGGKIFVFTGILPVSANDDGLATVMGHEIAHVVARHGAERMSYMKVLFAVSFLLESLGLDVGLSRLLVTFMIQLPNSRTNESEADTIGLQLMSRACYDPAESTKMWERMSADGGASNIDFMSTHPANKKRIKQLTKELPGAEQIAEQSCGVVNRSKEGFGVASGMSGMSSFWR